MSETKEETIELETLPLRKNFRLPKNIKVVKLLIAIILNIIMGTLMFVMGILYFVTDVLERSFYTSFFAVFMILVGVVLLGQSPLVLARTFNARLIITDSTVKIRNSFKWKEVKWSEVEEIMIRQKLKKELDAADIIGIDIVRFRTVAGGIHFLADNFPADDAEEIIQSIVESFEDFHEDTEYYVAEKAERPSLKYRYLYFNKTLE